MEGAHDLGGLDGFGPVVTADGAMTHHEPWELRAQGLALLGVHGALRPWIERLEPATYLSSSYYARWLRAAEDGVVAQGLVSASDLTRWRARFADDPTAVPAVTTNEQQRQRIDYVMTHPDRLAPATAPRFAVGDGVVVRRWRDPAHHHRCPRYVRGVAGIVETVCGDEPVPGQDDRAAPTYTVAFSSVDLWGEHGERPFTVYVDLCEDYLATAAETAST